MTAETEPQLTSSLINAEGQELNAAVPFLDANDGQLGVPEDLNVNGDAAIGGNLRVEGSLEIHGDLVVSGRIIEKGKVKEIEEVKTPRLRKKFERFQEIRRRIDS